jgi:hypothetical protein
VPSALIASHQFYASSFLTARPVPVSPDLLFPCSPRRKLIPVSGSWLWSKLRPSGNSADNVPEGEISKKVTALKKKVIAAPGKKHARDEEGDEATAEDDAAAADDDKPTKKRGRPPGVIKKTFPPTKKPKKVAPPKKPYVPTGGKRGRPKGVAKKPKAPAAESTRTSARASKPEASG